MRYTDLLWWGHGSEEGNAVQVHEFYQAIGVDFDEVRAFFRKEDRLKRYLVQTMDDPAFPSLDEAMKNAAYDEAFRAAHTIKGMSLNLMIKPMTDVTVDLVETLRGGEPDPAEATERYRAFKSVSDEVASYVRSLV